MKTRDEILAIIKKWSSDHEGRTPSEKVFREATEIPLDTLQKHGWASYGEFCDEAGLKRNKFDKSNPDYVSEKLSELFIDAIREKGKWPTKGELEVSHKRNKNIPGSAIYYKKLGLVKNGKLSIALLNYIKDRPGYEDIAKICNSLLETIKNEDFQEPGTKNKNGHGWVYLIRLGHSNQYRIGQTNDPLRRFKENRIELPEKPILVHEIETADRYGVEDYWLKRFKTKKTENEYSDWFKLSSSDVREFKAWKRIV